jgi:hypothetical protein
MKGWTTNPVFYLTLGIVVFLPIGMYIWFRRRTWL